jgi:hypothetical protein
MERSAIWRCRSADRRMRVSPRSKGQRPGLFARFGMRALVTTLLLIPVLSLGLAEPVDTIVYAQSHSDVNPKDFGAPRYRSTITMKDSQSNQLRRR